MSLSKRLLNLIEDISLCELREETVQSFADKADMSFEEVKAIVDEIESSVADNIDREEEPQKFFAVVTQQVKRRLGIDERKNFEFRFSG